MAHKKLIVFTCNWHAYHGMEAAGTRRISYDPRAIPVRLTCMGRISTGIILKAFEQGAMGVLLLGCPEGDCQYESGMRLAENVVAEAKKFLALLGLSPDRLMLECLKTERDQAFAEKVNAFMKRLEMHQLAIKQTEKAEPYENHA